MLREPYFYIHDLWLINDWPTFLCYAPIRIQMLYRTDSAVLVINHDIMVYVVYTPAANPRTPRHAGYLSEDLDFVVLVVEV